MALRLLRLNVAAILVGVLPGCGTSPQGDSPVAATAEPKLPKVEGAEPERAGGVAEKATSSVSTTDAVDDFQPLSLSNVAADRSPTAGTAGPGNPEEQIQSIIQQLQPLQVLLGQWRGTTRREYGNFKAVDTHEWVWDLRTDPAYPALTIRSDKSPYLQTGRITFDPATQKFLLTGTDGGGIERKFEGEFTDPVHEVVGSDDKLHKVFRLEFAEVSSAENQGQEHWQLSFMPQENNRYLLEVGKRRGNAAFARFDTVSTQREGTSFAANDSDYAEKTCIISEGLGTIELIWKGRSYWVCCTGCRAAFEEDPEKWIARAAERSRKK